MTINLDEAMRTVVGGEEVPEDAYNNACAEIIDGIKGLLDKNIGEVNDMNVHAAEGGCILEVPVAWNMHRGLDLEDASDDQCGTAEDIQDFLKSLRDANIPDPDNRDVLIIIYPAYGNHLMDAENLFKFIAGRSHPAHHQVFDVMTGEEVDFANINTGL